MLWSVLGGCVSHQFGKAEVSMVRIMLPHFHCLIITVQPLAPNFVCFSFIVA